MKSKDFFKKLQSDGKIESEDFSKFSEAVPEFDIPDAVSQAFDEKFMTVDRALTHKDVRSVMKSQHLNAVDEKITAILSAMGHDKNHIINRETDTYKKIDLLVKEIPGALEKAGKGATNADEFKQKIKEKEDKIAELAAMVESVKTEGEQNSSKIKKDFDDQLHNYRLDHELEKLSAEYTFAEAHDKVRSTLQKALLGEIKASHTLKLADKNGKAEIHVVDEKGDPLFSKGNTQVTIKSLLDEAYKPLLKVSNGQQGQTNQQQRTETQTNPEFRQGVRNTVR